MIPEFDENGNLPPGVHFCEWEEFKDRFATNLTRQRMLDGLELAMTQLKAAGSRTIYINGSFVTSKEKPGDFDACWDSEDVDYDYLRKNAPKLLNHLERNAQKSQYKGELFRSDQPVGDDNLTSLDFFQQDRLFNAKGIIAIDLFRWKP